MNLLEYLKNYVKHDSVYQVCKNKDIKELDHFEQFCVESSTNILEAVHRIEEAIKYVAKCEEELLPAHPLWIDDLFGILKGEK